MSTSVTMPQLSETMKEGKLLRWCVQPGDYVYEGDALAEIEADKANMELEALAAGTVKELLAQPGQVVEVGQAVATVEEGPAPQGAAARIRESTASVAGDGIAVSALAARMAEERGINLSQVKGTGPGGAITPQDVEAHAAGKPGTEA